MDSNAQIIDLQYFAPITWYKNLNSFTHIVFDKYETHQKRNFINRCLIAGANGPILLSVPLIQGRDQKTPVKDLRIANDENWQKRHWRSILSSYNSSPWFHYFKDEMAGIYLKHFEFLIDWNYECLRWTFNKLRINIKLDWIDHLEPDDKNKDNRYRSTRKKDPEFSVKSLRYQQVFEDKIGFIENLSILDLMFCAGPNKTMDILNYE